MAEQIEIQFGTQNQVGPRDIIDYIGVNAATGSSTFGMCVWLKSIKSTGFSGLSKKVSCAKTGGPILTIYTSYGFLRKDLPVGVLMTAPVLKCCAQISLDQSCRKPDHGLFRFVTWSQTFSRSWSRTSLRKSANFFRSATNLDTNFFSRTFFTKKVHDQVAHLLDLSQHVRYI